MANPVSRSGEPIWADTRGLSRLARNLRAASPAAWKATRVELLAVGEVIANDARQRASFSTRIPATIKVRVTGGGNVKIVAGGTAAPEAAPLEHKGQAGTFRHPVFDNREVWVEQRARPFLGPALEAHRAEAAVQIEATVTEAVRRVIGGM